MKDKIFLVIGFLMAGGLVAFIAVVMTKKQEHKTEANYPTEKQVEKKEKKIGSELIDLGSGLFKKEIDKAIV